MPNAPFVREKPDDLDRRPSKAKCGYREAISLAPRFPIVETSSRADNIADYFDSTLHAAEPSIWPWLWCRGYNFGDGLSEASHTNWLTSLTDLFEDAEALGFELGDGDFLHVQIVLWSETMVKRFRVRFQ